MTGSGQERRIGAVRNISALPPRADVGADIVERPLSAKALNRFAIVAAGGLFAIAVPRGEIVGSGRGGLS